MAKIIKVGKKNSQYEVVIARNAVTKTRLSKHLKSKNKILVITDSGIPSKYIRELKNLLSFNKQLYIHEIPCGEKSKSFSTFVKIQERLADLKFDRSDSMIAFGGGVVGDMTGYS